MEMGRRWLWDGDAGEDFSSSATELTSVTRACRVESLLLACRVGGLPLACRVGSLLLACLCKHAERLA